MTGFASLGLAVACEPADCTTNFRTGGNNLWSNPASWDTGAVPTATDIACVGIGFDVMINDAQGASVKGLKTASNIFIVNSSLTIANNQLGGAATARFLLFDSTISIGGGAGKLTMYGGEIHGSGTIQGSVIGAGKVSPGKPFIDDIGQLTVTGDLDLDKTTVPIHLRGDVSGTQDRLSVGGKVSFTGAHVGLLPLPNFDPAPHTTLRPIVSATREGSPHITGAPDCWGTGKQFELVFGANGLDLAITHCDPAAFGPYTTYTESLAGKDLRYCQLYTSVFSGIDLTGADLRGAILWDGDFTGANLTNVDLRGVEIGGSTFVGANLTGAKLNDQNLSGMDLTRADLTNADLSGTQFAGATFHRVRSSGIVGTPASLPPWWELRSRFLVGPGADLSGRKLNLVNLSSLNLTGADITGSSLSGTNFAQSQLSRLRSGGNAGNPASLPVPYQPRNGFVVGPLVDLSGKTLTSVNLSNVNLTGADLRNAHLENVSLHATELGGAFLTGAKGVSLTGQPYGLPSNSGVVDGFLIAPGVDLSNELLYNVNLAGRPYSLRGANLAGASIVESNLHRLDLNGANLTGARIERTEMSFVDLRNANLGTIPVGGTFGSFLRFNQGPLDSLMPPQGWSLQLNPLQANFYLRRDA